MRKAKIATTIFFILGLILIGSMPWVLAAKPPATAPFADKRFFAAWFIVYSMALLVVFFGAVVSAWIVVRKQREEFRIASLSNMKDLIEATLIDHAKKKEDS